MPRPASNTYPPYFETYISQVKEDDPLLALQNQQSVIDEFFPSISEEKSEYAYAEGKWTLKELLQHIIDAERIFCYRSLSFARNEKQSLPGFEEDDYAAVSEANKRSWSSLCNEFKAVRKATICLYKSYTDEMLSHSGLANNKVTSVNAVGFIMAGHVTHHKKVIEERYLVNSL